MTGMLAFGATHGPVCIAAKGGATAPKLWGRGCKSSGVGDADRTGNFEGSIFGNEDEGSTDSIEGIITGAAVEAGGPVSADVPMAFEIGGTMVGTSTLTGGGLRARPRGVADLELLRGGEVLEICL